MTTDSFSDCTDQDFIELHCGVFIVLCQQAQQVSDIASHLRGAFVQVKFHQLLYQTLMEKIFKIWKIERDHQTKELLYLST